MSDRSERFGKNEALFREVNERIREVTTYEGEVEFLCECGDATCAQTIGMGLGEYEDVRAHGKRFVVLTGHEAHDVEQVVFQTERYLVVQKLPGVPTEVAGDSDSRD